MRPLAPTAERAELPPPCPWRSKTAPRMDARARSERSFRAFASAALNCRPVLSTGTGNGSGDPSPTVDNGFDVVSVVGIGALSGRVISTGGAANAKPDAPTPDTCNVLPLLPVLVLVERITAPIGIAAVLVGLPRPLSSVSKVAATVTGNAAT